MMEKTYQGKCRIPSTRLTGWDYRNSAASVVAIGTHHLTGGLASKQHVLRQRSAGAIAQKGWVSIPLHPSQVNVGTYARMPNHVHGSMESIAPPMNEFLVLAAPTKTLRGETPIRKNKKVAAVSQKTGSLSAIICIYKSALTAQAISRPYYTKRWRKCAYFKLHTQYNAAMRHR